jgi:uncharacterized protein YbcI
MGPWAAAEVRGRRGSRPQFGRIDVTPEKERALDPATQLVRAEITRRLSRIHADYYGKGPTKGRCYLVEDIVVVVLEETFTAAEKTLIARGRREAIEQTRRAFQDEMRELFVSVIEQTTGRSVVAFASDTDFTADVAIESFLLGEQLTDMHGFEGQSEYE